MQKEVAVPSLPGPGECSARDRLALFMSGALKPEDLTDEEVLRGQVVGRNLKFSGRGDGLMPRKMAGIIQRELKYRMEAKFQEHVGEAIETIVDVMHNGEGEQYSIGQKGGTKRLDAAKYVVDRVLGPIQKDVRITDERTPWQEAIESGTLLVDVENPEIVVEAEVVDEDDERPRRQRGRRGA